MGPASSMMCQVVLVPGVVLTTVGLKQIVACSQLKCHAGKGPDISRSAVARAYQHLQGPILPGLNVLSEVVLDPTGVTKVGNLDLEVLHHLNAGVGLPLLLGEDLREHGGYGIVGGLRTGHRHHVSLTLLLHHVALAVQYRRLFVSWSWRLLLNIPLPRLLFRLGLLLLLSD